MTYNFKLISFSKCVIPCYEFSWWMRILILPWSKGISRLEWYLDWLSTTDPESVRLFGLGFVTDAKISVIKLIVSCCHICVWHVLDLGATKYEILSANGLHLMALNIIEIDSDCVKTDLISIGFACVYFNCTHVFMVKKNKGKRIALPKTYLLA